LPDLRLRCRDKVLDLSYPAIMGIVNLTPDSFSDGGQLYAGNRLNQSKTLAAIEKMLNNGADIIDLGGESTRRDQGRQKYQSNKNLNVSCQYLS